MNAPAHQFPATTGPQQSTALARILRIARGLTMSTIALSGLALAAQNIMPVGWRPSDLIGGLHGAIEAADADAKRESLVELARRQAEEVSREQAKVQAEIIVLQHQMQTLSDSMGVNTGMTQLSDFGCIIGQFVSSNARTADGRNTGAMLRSACGYAETLRDEAQERYQRLARSYSALIARDDQLHRQAVELRERIRKGGR